MAQLTPLPPAPSKSAPHPVAAVVVSTAAAVAALASSLALEPYVERVVFPLLIATVALSAWWGGLRAGLAATVVGGVGTGYFFEEPRHSFDITNVRTALDWILFVLATVLISALSANLRALAARAERMRREAETGREALYRLAAIVESSHDAIIGKTLDGTITSWNPGAQRLYGYAPHEVIGRPISVLVPPDHADEVPAILASIRAGERVEHFETVRIRKDGERVDVSVSISPVRNAAGEVTGAAAIARDISERKRLETAYQELLRQRAITDGLTGLPNRAHLDERITEVVALARRHGRALSCLMIDIDHFKRINDTYGHSAGDAVLREMASRFREACRATDVVGRYGGEEFTALLPETDAEGSVAVAEKIRAAAAATLVAPPGVAGRDGAHGDPLAIPVRVSVGAATLDETMVDGAALLEAADKALYVAKAAGRDRVVHQGMQSEAATGG